MNKRIIFFAALLIMLVSVMMLTACGQWANPYDVLDGEGSTVSVRFLAGEGGMFAGTNGVTVVDVFDVDNYQVNADGKIEIKLIDPSDKNRGNNAFEISRTGHALAGWFIAEPVTNERGESLDEDGNPVSESGKDPALTVGRKWDFANDRLVVDPVAEHTGKDPALTLTAVWIPYVSFEFYEKVDGSFVKIGDYQGISLELPEWNLDTGKLNYKNFIELDGRTFEAAYLDEDMTVPMTGKVEGEFDEQTGTSLTPVIKIYTTWLEGEWFKISSVSQFSKNASVKGCYELLADIDFSETTWPNSLSGGEFRGQIKGNGHKISGITTNAYVTKGGGISHGGIFGSLAAEAVISDVTFENITYTIKSAAKASDAVFGLLAGTNAGATLTNVSVSSSKIILTADFCIDFAHKITSESFKIALLIAEGDRAGIDVSGISYELEDPASVSVSADANGNLSFVYPE